MTLFRSLIAVALLAFAAALAAFTLLDGPPPAPASEPVQRAEFGTTAERVADLVERARRDPTDAVTQTDLAAAYLQLVRETGKPALYDRASAAIERALELDRANPAALYLRGSLHLSRHEFREALADGRRALRSEPSLVVPLGVIVDAQVELGRYRAAERTLQTMVNRRPDLSSYARVSYLRELHGDVPGALAAMRRAASAGGVAPENAASSLTIVSRLHFLRGDYRSAAGSARASLARFPGYPAGLARLADARAALGATDAALALRRRAFAGGGLPEYALELGEAELAAGNRAAAERHFARFRALMADAPEISHERALFEAEHGNPRRGVALARDVWAAAPSVESAGILSWALTQAGRPEAGARLLPRVLSLGTRDPLVLYRAGMTARAAGDAEQARRLLSRALDASPRFSTLYAPRARAALNGL